VLKASGVNDSGLKEVRSQIEKFVSITRENNSFEHHRKQQLISIMNETIRDSLTTRFYTSNAIEKQIKNYENRILNDKITPYEAAEKLLTIYKNNL